MKSPIIITGAIAIATAALIYNFVSTDSSNLVSQNKNELINTAQDKNAPAQYQAEVLAPTGLSKLVYESQNINTGVIGIDPETNIDDPHDNTFHVYLDGDVESGRQAWLEYDLYGAEDFTSVSRAINDQVAVGGAFVKLSQEWSVQREKIDASQLHKGDNIVRFSIPGDKDFNYTVKNVRIRFDESVDMSRRIVLNQPMSKSYYYRYGYISGFVSGSGSENVKIYANGKPVRSNLAAFEGIVDQIASNGTDWKAVITAVFEDGQIISDTARFCNPATCDFSNEISSDIAYNETTVNAQLPAHLNVQGFELNGEPGSVSNKVKMSVTGLRSQDMALPRLAMVNVTGGSDGFRCLPHGNLFAKEVEVRIKYDTARIPKGYGPKDIRTFYYSEEQGDWIMLPYDTFDLVTNEIISHTNHFTDFINAILKTPESPQTQAFTPTSMKDMKYAEPIAHINMMSPPQANNSGTANLSLPIQVPAGRQGMQPQLAITYNSEGGNGWLGVGWGMNIPSISVETRWGVPTYSSTFETEEYLVNGQQVVEIDSIAPDSFYRWPLVHQASYKARSTNNVELYSYRVEGSFDRIIRHGSSPSTYWWEVVDKQGTHYYYGKYSSDAGVNPHCVLRDTLTNNIAHWALAEVRDLYGNYMKYNYQTVTYTGAPGNGGKQIYPESIVYTGFGNTDGLYTVNFRYDAARDDYQISSRYGFLEVTDRLLARVYIRFNGQFIRSYGIKYKTGAYNKNLICAIAEISDSTQHGITKQETCETLDAMHIPGVKVHSFQYYEEEGMEFNNSPVTILSSSDYQETVLYGAYTDPETQSLGKSKGSSKSIGGSLSFGLGSSPNKGNSIGANFSLSIGSMSDKVTIMDINGDGISDKIVKDGGSYKYYKGYLNSGNQLIFSSSAVVVSGLPSLNKSQSLSTSLGGELEVKLAALKGTASITGSITKQTTQGYFADVNADGYTDYIDYGQVYFNKPDTSDDPAFFSEDCNTIQYFAEDSCYYIIHDGEIDSAFYEVDEENNMYYRRDPVRVWISPTDTKVSIFSSIRRDNSSSATNFSTIKYSIQIGDSIWLCDSIAPGDTTLHLDTICSIGAGKGTRIYFRTHSDDKDGVDDVIWKPVLGLNRESCMNFSQEQDADEKDIYFMDYNKDNLLSDKQQFFAPLSGLVRITGSISSPQQSDSLHLIVNHNATSILDSVFYNGVIDSLQILDTVSVNEGDSIQLKLLSNTNVNWNDIEYNCRIQYLEADSMLIDTTNPFYSIDFYPSLFMSTYPARKQYSSGKVLSPGSHTIYPSLQFQSGTNVSGTVTFVAKRKRDLLEEKTLVIQNSQILGSPLSNSLQFSMAKEDFVYFEYYTSDIEIGNALNLATAIDSINDTTYTCGFHWVYPDTSYQFGNLYRGWGQFSYYDSSNVSSCLDPIDESLLSLASMAIDTNVLSQFPLNDMDTTMSMQEVDSIFNTLGIPDIFSIPFAPMTIDYVKNIWVDFCPSAFIKKNSVSGSSLGFSSIYESLTDTAIFDSEDFPLVDFDSPVPISNSCGTKRVISKRSLNTDGSFSFSVGNDFKSLSITANFSESFGKDDYMDLNGDRYPDLIDHKLIQYTTPQGGLSTNKLWMNEGRTSHGNGNGNGASLGIKGIKMKSTSAGQSSKSKVKNIDGSFGIGGYNGVSEVNYLYADINGDGLPDIIDQKNQKVQFNLGYSFNNEETWSSVELSRSSSGSISINFGSLFSYDNYSWSGGLGGSMNDSYDSKMIADVNNDGLSDVCYVTANGIEAWINTGNEFYHETMNMGFIHPLSHTKAFNVSGNIALTIPIPLVFVKFLITPYMDASFNLTSEKYRLTDLNGDGFMDFAYVDGNNVNVNYGIPKKVNMLKKVTTPTKSSYTMDYAMTYPERDCPQSKWVYSSLMVYDGFNGDGQDTTYNKFRYENPKYHRMERESFGFETVTTEQYRSFAAANCYRSMVQKFHNDDFMFKGLKYYDVNLDTNNHKFVETYYVWDPKEISSGDIIPRDSMGCFGPYYPAISQEDKYFYEGDSFYTIHSKKTYRHGPHGNVKQYVNYGDTAYTDDDFRAEIIYSYDSGLHLLAMVDTINIFDNGSALLQRRIGDYTPEGKISKIGAFDGSSYAYTDITYDLYGNIIRIKYPADVNNQRLQYSYEYDNIVHTYPESVTDFWGNTSYTDYNFKLGLPVFVYDISGNPMKFTYYADGKLDTIVGPNELNNNVPYTIICEYWDEGGGSAMNRWARTRHYDPMNSGNEFITVNFSDGMGRSVQSKKKATINGVDSMVVSGKTDYDAFGRAYRTSLPTTQALGFDFQYYSFTPTVYATTTFDVMDRPLVQTAFDNTQVGYNYYFGQDAFGITCFQTIFTDPNGIQTTKYTNARGMNTSVTAPLSTITKFIYDPLGTLIESDDPDGNRTLYNYDLLNRLLKRRHPDAGNTYYSYDLAGNVLTTQTENLAGSSQYIQYNYADCRLKNIKYPQNPEMNVYYEYGTPNSSNQSGRLIKQQDASGVQTFAYGSMGELIKNIHTFVVPNGNAYTYETDWVYDSWNRIDSITYPDGEVATYSYNNGGQLTALNGVKGLETFAYIDSIKYNRYGSRTLMDYGNGTYSVYTYDPLNQRLTNLTSYEASALVLQSIEYTYDNASNITQVQNISDYVNGQLGGNYKYSFEYDELYRLTMGGGEFQSANFGSIGFMQNLEYSASGNIVRKYVNSQQEIGGGLLYSSYDRNYDYNDRPHTVTATGDFSYKWDPNGNLIYREESQTGYWRKLCWDEENRLTTVHNEVEKFSNLSSYIYNAGGERAWKLAGDVNEMYINGIGYVQGVDFGKTLYASPYLVVDDEEYTKHYYIEGERVCTKIGGHFMYAPTPPLNNPLPLISGDINGFKKDLRRMVDRGIECAEFNPDYVTIDPYLGVMHRKSMLPETNLYFYHPDHLGSSSFITDATGYAVQHLQYLPFGETFVDQQKGYDARYTFSAKEKDDETQYSYFGARYYDSDLSVWLSVDPMAVKYPSSSPYLYVAGNPLVLCDPNGEEWVDEVGNSKWDQNANNGKGDYTEYATNNDKALMDKVRQTEQGKKQFDKLVSCDQKIQININEVDLITDEDGTVLGKTDNTTKKLSYENGAVSATVKESKITLYILGIDQFVKDMESFEMKMGDKSIPKSFDWWDIIALVTGHEIEHSTDENWSLSLGGKDFETPAYEITYKMIEELIEHKEKK